MALTPQQQTTFLTDPAVRRLIVQVRHIDRAKRDAAAELAALGI